MQAEVYEWVADVVKRYDLAALHTLEVGSFDVNGSVDNLFTGLYWGVDARPGPGVDQVCDGEALPFDPYTFNVVVSTDTLEHVRHPWRFVAEMGRVVKLEGYVILTTVGYGFPIHDHPHDYWRFGPGTLEILLGDAGLELVEAGGVPPNLFRLARRRPGARLAP